MKKLNYKEILVHLLVLLVIYTVIALPTLGRISLWETDEGRYLIPAQNALSEGKWIIPEYNGRPRIAKPPLMVWLVAASTVILGKKKVDEFSARLPSFLFGLLAVLVLYFFCLAAGFRTEQAFFSAYVLSTAYAFVKYARFAITDMVLLFFILLSVFLFFLFTKTEKDAFLVFGFVSCAFGFMDKGPVGVVLPVGIFLLFLISERKTELLFGHAKGLCLGFLIFLVLSMWWPVYVGKPYWSKFIVGSNIKRFAANPEWKTSTFFYIYNFPAHFFVWSALFPAVIAALRERKENLGIFVIWFFFVFVLFSLSETKRTSYILPLYPAAAAITGYALGVLKENELFFEKELRTSVKILILGFATALVLSALNFFKHSKILEGLVFLIPILLVPTAVKMQPVKAFLIAAFVFAAGYANVYQPLADRAFHSPKPCAEAIKKAVGEKPLFAYGSTRANELYYIGKKAVRRLPEGAKGVFVYTRKPEKFEKKHPEAKKILCCGYQDEKLCLYKLP